MNKRLYVDFHILQTVPPSCINRDDTGSPKTAVYGGVLRARVSSQAWKHAMRAAFAENARLDVGKRTKKAADLVKEQILVLVSDADADKLAKKALDSAGIKSDDKGTKALFFMSSAQAKALAELAVAGSTDKKEYQKALKAVRPAALLAALGLSRAAFSTCVRLCMGRKVRFFFTSSSTSYRSGSLSLGMSTVFMPSR